MHSPNEMVAREDLERAARLLAAFARRLDPKISSSLLRTTLRWPSVKA